MQRLKNKFKPAELKVKFKTAMNPTIVLRESDASKFFHDIWDKSLYNVQEQVYVLYLNPLNEVVCWKCLHTGTINSTKIDFRLLFGFALGCLATGIIIAHNHPTGKLEPSQSDLDFTFHVKEIGNLLNVRLVDHLIVGGGRSLSFKSKGFIK